MLLGGNILNTAIQRAHLLLINMKVVISYSGLVLVLKILSIFTFSHIRGGGGGGGSGL